MPVNGKGAAQTGARNEDRTRTTSRSGKFKLDHPVSADIHDCPSVQLKLVNVRRRTLTYLGGMRLELRLLTLALRGGFIAEAELVLGPSPR